MTIFDLAQRPGELYALSALIGECDSLRALRLVVAHTRAAFRLPSKADERAFQVQS